MKNRIKICVYKFNIVGCSMWSYIKMLETVIGLQGLIINLKMRSRFICPITYVLECVIPRGKPKTRCMMATPIVGDLLFANIKCRLINGFASNQGCKPNACVIAWSKLSTLEVLTTSKFAWTNLKWMKNLATKRA